MKIVIVGQKQGKASVCWLQYIGLSLVLSLVIGLGCGSVYFFLAGAWSAKPVFLGIFMAVGMVTLGLINGLRTPPEKLAPIK